MIFVKHQPPVTPEELEEKIELLRDAFSKNDEFEDTSVIREVLHRIVLAFRKSDELNTPQGVVVEIPPQTVEV